MTGARHDARTVRPAPLGVVLAVLAIFGLIALSSWHNAVVHDDDAVHVSSIEHRHVPPKQADPDAPIHLLAHAVGQWVSTSGSFAAPALAGIATRTWVAFEAGLGGGIDPAELLRPPRG